jgi:bile acid:Na+ symporter, BASS family
VIASHSPFKALSNAYGKVIALVLMMILGALLPQFHSLSFLIQYLLMAMLFLAFLDIEIKPGSFQKGVIWTLLANVAVAFAGYWLLSPVDRTLALVAFITGIAPTAIASPVMISFIMGNVEYAAAAVLLTNLSMALIVPIALPFVVGSTGYISTWGVLEPVLLVMFVPLLLAMLVRRLPQKVQTVIRKGKPVSFPLWLANLFITCAKAADFLHNEVKVPAVILGKIALVSLAVCIVNFAVGALIGGRQHWQESSQALGQKNNSFVIWIALTFISPLIAMGPTFYIIYHNLYNSFQIYLFESRRYDPAQKELSIIPTHIER